MLFPREHTLKKKNQNKQTQRLCRNSRRSPEPDSVVWILQKFNGTTPTPTPTHYTTINNVFLRFSCPLKKLKDTKEKLMDDKMKNAMENNPLV